MFRLHGRAPPVTVINLSRSRYAMTHLPNLVPPHLSRCVSLSMLMLSNVPMPVPLTGGGAHPGGPAMTCMIGPWREPLPQKDGVPTRKRTQVFITVREISQLHKEYTFAKCLLSCYGYVAVNDCHKRAVTAEAMFRVVSLLKSD